MKNKFFTTSIALLLLFSTNGIQAQTTPAKLEQTELFKKFVGTWKCELAKDTTLIVNVKSYGDGLDYYIKSETKGKLLMEGKALMGYDKKSEKGIQTEIMGGPNVTLWVYWFISKNFCKVVHYKYITDPDSATKFELFDFKSPDLIVQTFMDNNKPTNSLVFQRVK
jgi:hypothetical protein